MRKKRERLPLIAYHFSLITFSASSSAENIQVVTKTSLPLKGSSRSSITAEVCVMKRQRSFARNWEVYAASVLLALAVVASLAVRTPHAAHAQNKQHVAAVAPSPSATPTTTDAPKPVKIDLAT